MRFAQATEPAVALPGRGAYRASVTRIVSRLCLVVIVSVVCGAAGAAPAGAQQPVSPANGAQIPESEVILRWTLPHGWQTDCVQLSHRPETTYPGGPFLDPAGTDCALGPRDEAYLLEDLDLGVYYWQVKASRYHCDDDLYGACDTEESWGPVAYFDSVNPPPPPPPTGCNGRAAAYFGENDLLPYAKRRYRRYYKGITAWGRTPVVCRDLTGDGKSEMIVRMVCCTGGSLSPWAIYKRDSAGQWRRAFAQVRHTVWRLRVKRRVVRTMSPAPYEGACTRFGRYWNVRWNGKGFRSKRGARTRLTRPSACSR